MAVFSYILLILTQLLAAVVPAQAAMSPPDPRFGIVESFVNPAAAGEAGAGYTRIILRWDVIQPAGPVDWKPANVPDPAIEAELAAGRKVFGLLIGTPDWAIAADWTGDRSSRAVPDMFYWEAFARRMAQQYQGRIRHWIIWNEPDVWMEGHPGRTWDGTVEDYARLLKTAYLAIKAVDPTMRVHVAGMTYYWDWEHGRRRYLDRLLEVIGADPQATAAGYTFDGVTYHLYFNPSQTVDVLNETRQLLARHGLTGKEISINETNAPPSEDPLEAPWSTPRFRVSLDEQSAFVLQEFALAFSSGATRVEVYKLRNSADHPESIEPFGLLRGDNTPRPAFAAYTVATTYLRDFTTARREQQGDLLAVTFDRGEATTTVLWTKGRSPLRVRVKAITPEALLIDERGQARTIPAVGGQFTIDLPGAACTQRSGCFIGGAPRLLVEQGRSNGRPALGIGAPPAKPSPPKPSGRQLPAWKSRLLDD